MKITVTKQEKKHKEKGFKVEAIKVSWVIEVQVGGEEDQWWLEKRQLDPVSVTLHHFENSSNVCSKPTEIVENDAGVVKAKFTVDSESYLFCPYCGDRQWQGWQVQGYAVSFTPNSGNWGATFVLTEVELNTWVGTPRGMKFMEGCWQSGNVACTGIWQKV